MSGIFQLDSTILTMVQNGLDDLAKNPWLLDHIFEDYKNNQYLQNKYGQSQIDAAKEWFRNNKINIALKPKSDKDELPMVAIIAGPANEKPEMKHMGDSSTESIILMPQDINKPIPYIVKPFTPLGYDKETGILDIDTTLKGMDNVSVGMILVNPENGQGFSILDILPDALQIETDLELNASQLGIVPQFPYYKANIEHTFFDESVAVNCHCHGDPQSTSWLHSIVLYCILRYRESLLEANGFTQSTVSNGPLSEDPYYNGAEAERAFMRSINITGQSEHTWIKQPRRFIEKVDLKEKVGDDYIGGIKILSNLDSPDFIDKAESTWYTESEE